MEPSVGLQAFVVIHNTKRGPALGGCRFIEYASCADALTDALRLGRGMSLKAAMANLNYGGGKAVLMRPAQPFDRVALFAEFGKFVNELGGRYITALDSGSELTDLDVVAQQTAYVSGTSADQSDPSPHTVRGVYRSMEAAIKFQFNKTSFKGMHIAIQGMGHVGHDLAQRLHQQGATLTIADKNQALAMRYAEDLNARVVAPEAINEVVCDVFAPCALGGILNKKTIPLLKTSVVVGAANNQLDEPKADADLLMQRGILYAPDFVANAGGLIFATMDYEHKPIEKADEKIDEIYDTMMAIFSEAKSQQCSTEMIAEKIAEERLR
ncbi:MAG: amino acid dehydrogenase [Gammaproteobacteria bacterium]|nr:amino acid dehydrogenase [Gammaproteobacteria bacterium]